ncbi:MAG: acetyl-CoA carboxylase biotin carboxyl carrier protein [Bacillota bacterium]|nr:acetyl-CoA carboxylase biotin carboxyl carrier protein [Thermoanaerobacteraceae bacterium]
MERPVKIMDTTLRDGHQSLWATRMRTEDMLPIAERLDAVGYHALEVWGGATFDVCLRYLYEDPWERLRELRKRIKNTRLQMLLRGQSLVGYGHYADDVAEAFVRRAVANGLDVIRIFDALNDIRNLEFTMKVAKEAGAHVQATVVYTLSPVHTTEHYLETAKKLVELGADSICIKDMAGMMSPYSAFQLVSLFKKKLPVPVQLHCHYIGGMAVGAYLKAAEAGVDIVDTASAPLAFGASQPPVETVVRALRETPYNTGLRIKELFEIAGYFEEVRKKRGFERGVTRIHDMQVFEHQVPGGMISNLVTQLQEQKAIHRLQDVLNEIPRVRAELGYPPLVTPTSQIVGTQAVLNVLAGERYKFIPEEVRRYVQGFYGRPPGPIDPEIQKKVLNGREPITCRPADLLEPVLEKLREEIKDLATSEEDVLSYALFPQVARRFLEARKKGEIKALAQSQEEKKAASPAKEAEGVNIKEIRELLKLLEESDVTEFSLETAGTKLTIRKGSGHSVRGDAATETPLPAPAAKAEKEAVPAEDLVTVQAPMVGTFYRAPAPDAPPYVQVGDVVEKGQVLCIIEAMKLMNEIQAEVAGEIVEILVENGHPVEYGQPLFLIRKKG